MEFDNIANKGLLAKMLQSELNTLVKYQNKK